MLENAMVSGTWPYNQEFVPDVEDEIEPEPVNPCPYCNCEMTDEEYALGIFWVCSDCFDAYLEGLTTHEIADLMGIDWRVK